MTAPPTRQNNRDSPPAPTFDNRAAVYCTRQCRFCYAPSTDHVSSQYPHINPAYRGALIKRRDAYFKAIADRKTAYHNNRTGPSDNNKAVSFNHNSEAPPPPPPPQAQGN